MPITVSYQPPAQDIYNAAYLGGLGQYNERRRGEALQWAELAQRDLAQQRGIAANQYSQAMAQQAQARQAGLDRQFRAGMNQFDAFQAAQNREDTQKWQEDRDKFFLDKSREQWQEQANRQDQQDAARAMAAAEDDRRKFIMGQYESGNWTLGQAALSRLQKIRADMEAIKRDRRWSPEDKQAKLAELEGDYWNTLGSPQPPLPNERPKPISERVPQETFREPVYAINPDGSQGAFMGWQTWTEETRNGQKRLVPKFDPYKPPTAGKSDPTPGSPQAEEEEFNKFVDGFVGEQKDVPGARGQPSTKKDYTEEEIWKLWQQKKRLRDRFRGRTNPVADEYRDRRASGESAREAYGTMAGQQQPPQQPMLPPPPLPADQRAPGTPGGPPPAAPSVSVGGPASEGANKPAPRSFALPTNELPPGTPRTPQEAAKAGWPFFIDENGVARKIQ